MSAAIEAKAGEPFDRIAAEWIADASAKSGKTARLAQLSEMLGIEREEALTCRYQLLHRPVAALLEARRFQIQRALFLVQAFGDNRVSFTEYQHWAQLLGATVAEDSLYRLRSCSGIDLWTAWINAPTAGPSVVRAAV